MNPLSTLEVVKFLIDFAFQAVKFLEGYQKVIKKRI